MSTPSQYDLPERVPGPSNSRRDSGNIGLGMKFSGGEDPRRTSSESLRPPPSYDQAQRRKLLLVYIHGFMGNDQSFQKFPYHLHKLLTETIESTHVVHTKIYPRYKTYKAIEVARDNFSTWLQPHESPTTDVVLLGHSMGGLLAADVVTMPAWNPGSSSYFQHRILGTANLDAPLLGLHPGIITSGIASLFRGKPDPPIKPIDGSSRTESGTSQRSHSTDIDSITTGAVVPIDRPGEPDTQSRDTRRYTVDPYFNQPFPNDVNFRDRGWWKNVVHFVKKHNSEGLMDAATNHLMSHMKFGACLMDFAGLKRRYETLRKLEDIDDIKHHGMPHVPARIRFVQYYTVCYGYPKKPKDQATTEQETTASEDLLEAEGSSQPSTRRISAEEHDGTESQIRTHQLQEIPKDEILDGQRSTSVVADNVSISSRHLGSEVFHTPSTSRPVSAKSRNSRNSHEAESSARLSTAPTDQENLAEPDSNPNGKESELVPDVTLSKLPLSVDQEVDEFERSLPPLPDVPKAPQYQAAQDPSNKEAAKYAEKENKRKLKDYERAIKSYEAAQKSRQKTLKKIRSKIEAERKKTLSKAEAKAEAEQKKERATEEAERKKEKATEEAERKKEKATEEAERKKADAKAKHDNQEAAEEKAKANAVAQDYHDLSRALASHATDVGGDNQKRSSMEILEPLPIEEELPLSEHTHQEELDNLLSPASTTDGKKIERTTEGVLPKPPARSSTKSTERSEKPRKLRKFCTTPSKVNGQMDEKWISVFMEDVDEVAAHTGLFFPGPQYEKLLGDVGIMIKSWVEEDATKRLLVENRFVP